VILVDTSIWIDHLHAAEPRLGELLEADEVGSHRFVVEELALGSIKRRGDVLDMIGNLRRFPVLAHQEVLPLVEGHRLWGRGLSAVDIHLLGSVALVPGARLWTRDKRLLAACRGAGVAVVKEK
jgi:predicted nucleic acid-binding protein